ncbi:MAG: hypothetical protein ACOYXT_18780 [Bacteroidota bacterium]
MRLLSQILIVIVLGFVLEMFMPWWCVALAAFSAGYSLKTQFNFVAGFVGVGLLWLVPALQLSSVAAAPLTERVANIFMINTPLLLIVTAVIGGLVGGFAAMTGAALRRDKKRSYY